MKPVLIISFLLSAFLTYSQTPTQSNYSTLTGKFLPTKIFTPSTVPIQPSNDSTIVIKIIVNPMGDVIDAQLYKSMITDTALIQLAISAARQSKFTKTQHQTNQVGYINYTFVRTPK